MKSAREITLSYGFRKIDTNDLTKLLNLFTYKNLFIEIVNISSNSDFYNNIDSSGVKYISSSTLNANIKPYTNLFIYYYTKENFTCVLDGIIDSKPEELIFYCTSLSVEQFLYCRQLNDKLIKHQTADCIIEVMFDENVMAVTFNQEQNNQNYLNSKIKDIVR